MLVFMFDEPIHVYCFPPKRHEYERPNTRMACASAHTLSRKINGTKVQHIQRRISCSESLAAMAERRESVPSFGLARDFTDDSVSVRELGPIFADPGHCYVWNQLQGRQPGLHLIFCLRAQKMGHALRGRVLICMMQECIGWHTHTHRHTRRRHDAQTFLLSSPDVLTVNTVP